jgi:coenzyme F420-reducing hydrogenase beta subunit
MAANHTENPRNFKIQENTQIRSEFLKGTKDEDLGVYCDLFSARTAIEGQDGGVVTALLVKGFKEGIFDSAIVVKRKDGCNAEAVVATNVDEIAEAKGTKYFKINVTQKLRELIDQGKKRIAIVCTPCEVKAVRKIQQKLKGDFEITIIGLFCFEAFNSTRLKKEAAAHLGIDLDKAQKTQIRQGKFTAFVDGKEYSCKVKDIESASEKVCRYCDDFTSQLADISVGSVGSQKGYSTIIVRSEVGEKLLKNLGAEREPVNREEIVKLSKFKRERAKKAYADLKNPQ